MNLFCIIKIINKNITINSFPNIYKNKYYGCIEFININEKIKLGIKIYKTKEKIENILEILIINIFVFVKVYLAQ